MRVGLTQPRGRFPQMNLILSDDYTKGSPAIPGGPLKSKLMRSRTWVLDRIGFFFACA